MEKADQKNRIKELREAAELTQDELAKRIGMSSQNLSRLENGHRRLHSDMIAKIAAALGRHPMEIMGGVPAGNVASVRGYVGAEDRAFPFDTKSEAHDVTLPFRTDGLVALRVRGHHLRPRFLDGEYLLYKPREGVDLADIGKDCVVTTPLGATYVKRLLRGYGDGVYRLGSYQLPEMEDVELVSASPIVVVILP